MQSLNKREIQKDNKKILKMINIQFFLKISLQN